MICRNCHKNIPSDSEICPECGARIKRDEGKFYDAASKAGFESKARESNAQQSTNSVFDTPVSTQKKRKNPRGVVFLVIALIMMLVIAVTSLIFVNMSRMRKRGQAVEKMEELINELGQEDLSVDELWDIVEGLEEIDTSDSEEMKEMVRNLYEQVLERMKQQTEEVDTPEEFKKYLELFNEIWNEGGDIDMEKFDELFENFDPSKLREMYESFDQSQLEEMFNGIDFYGSDGNYTIDITDMNKDMSEFMKEFQDIVKKHISE